mgnify:FL=1
MIELLRSRRSVRQFQDRAVDTATRQLLSEGLLRAPSSRNFQPWEFYWVDRREHLEALSKVKEHGAAFVARAPLAVVVAAREERSDVWIEDASIASIVVQLVAHSLGLGSCWAQIRRRESPDGGSAEEAVREVLGLSAGVRVLSIVAVGYPDEGKPPVAREALPWHKVHENHLSESLE